MLDDCDLDGGTFFVWLTDDSDGSYGEEIKETWLKFVKYYLNQQEVKKSERYDSKYDSSDDSIGISKYERGYGSYGSTWW